MSHYESLKSNESYLKQQKRDIIKKKAPRAKNTPAVLYLVIGRVVPVFAIILLLAEYIYIYKCT